VRAGELDRRIEIRTAAVSTNELNEPVETWIPAVTVKAKVMPISDGERFRAGEVSAQITTRFLIRWSITTSEITPKDRIVYGGKTFDIFHLKEIGRREGIEISAAARADQ